MFLLHFVPLRGGGGLLELWGMTRGLHISTSRTLGGRSLSVWRSQSQFRGSEFLHCTVAEVCSRQRQLWCRRKLEF
jgi:hypothetical protein